jgi:hypothetical protein
MTHDDVQHWLDRYIAAWRASERGPIEDLFTDDAVYRSYPYGPDDAHPHGRDAIVDAWLKDADDPHLWEAQYAPYAVDGDRAVATGTSRYVGSATKPERTYHNVFLLRFADDGRCSGFTELYMLENGLP